VNLIRPDWEPELFAYITGIVNNLDGRMIAINGVENHLHLLVRLGPTRSLSDCLRELKAGSSRWIRSTYDPKFSWQRRYGAFTVSESACSSVANYIANQKEHHGRVTFEDEYRTLLERHNVEYDEDYIWS
jgi:putative transposase